MSTPELEAIAELSEPLTMVRPEHAAKTVRGGKMSTPDESLVEFNGNLQPAEARQLRRLAPGTDARDVVVIFTGQELLDADVIEGTLALSMLKPGEKYIVKSVEIWTEGKFFEATALRDTGAL